MLIPDKAAPIRKTQPLANARIERLPVTTAVVINSMLTAF